MLANSYPIVSSIDSPTHGQQYKDENNDTDQHGAKNGVSAGTVHNDHQQVSTGNLSTDSGRPSHPSVNQNSSYMLNLSPQPMSMPGALLSDTPAFMLSETSKSPENPVQHAFPATSDTQCTPRPQPYSPSSSSSVYMTSMHTPTQTIGRLYSPPPRAAQLRLEFVLEAPPARTQQTDEEPLTYLNKGHFYCITLADTEKYDGDICTTVAIRFHHDSHQNMAHNYWRSWAGQQKEPSTARAIDMDMNRVQGVYNVQWTGFDRVTFHWNGAKGATILVRFNCLSTDFSRIKGVKGIPLRIHMESTATRGNDKVICEATYCKIKLFRDKGAERKNKDDAKHIERQLEKIRETNGAESHPLWLSYCQNQFNTVFTETTDFIPSTPLDADIFLDDIKPPVQRPRQNHSYAEISGTSVIDVSGSTTIAPYAISCPVPGATIPVTHPVKKTPPKESMPYAVNPLSSIGMKRTRDEYILQQTPSPDPVSLAGNSFAFASCSNLSHNENSTPAISAAYHRMLYNAADIDPTYVTVQKRRIAKLRFFAKFSSNDLYRAIYLENLTVQDLIEKLTFKMNLSYPVREVVRHVIKKDKNSITVRVDDAVVEEIPDEQDMEVETKMQKDGVITIVLRY